MLLGESVLRRLKRYCNKKIKCITNKQIDYFSNNSLVRNVDYLIISDMFDPNVTVSDGKSFVQIYAPKKSIKGCYEILRHTHSILRDDGNGCVVIALRKKYYKGQYSLFDTFFFHPVTISKMGLESLRKKANNPFRYAPISSLIMAFGKLSNHYRLIQNQSDDIVQFCNERHYQIKWYEK